MEAMLALMPQVLRTCFARCLVRTVFMLLGGGRQRRTSGSSEAKKRQDAVRAMNQEYQEAIHMHTSRKSGRRGKYEICRDVHVTLEDIHKGCVKKFRIKDKISHKQFEVKNLPFEAVFKVEVQPGYKPGTKIHVPTVS